MLLFSWGCLAAPQPPAYAQSTKIIEDKPVKIGVLAFRGIDAAIRRWTPTANYLGRTIYGYKFQIVPLSLDDMKIAVANNQLDFVLTNTGNYVDLEDRFGITRIATLRTQSKNKAGNVFGAVIFTRADRTDIQNLKDLKGKSFMAIKPKGFGGFQMAWRELQENGIDPFEDFSELKFSGFPQDNAAFAVLNSEVDAATFRTNTLETMEQEGSLKMSDFRILNRQSYPGFPFAVSTRLYPEWPFARMKETPEKLAQDVAIALLRMPTEGAAAISAGYGGWTVPLDYQPVHELFKVLRIGPYEDLGEITFTDLLKQHGHWIVLAVVVLLLTVGWATWIEVLVARRTRELSQTNEELERQISVRRLAEEDAHLRRAELAHVHRLNTLGEMASGFAHEINQPLSAISNYARGCIRRIHRGNSDQKELLGALEQVATQATRAGEVIKRIRTFVRKEQLDRVTTSINQVVLESLEYIKSEAQRHDITVETNLEKDLPDVEIDVVQVEQVILNLVRNALEAMMDSPSGERRLTVGSTLTDKGDICLTFTDTGPGLPGVGAESMFDPFVTSKQGGLGLGLSISRSIVEFHGGKLRASDSNDAGAVLSFTLPAVGAIEEEEDINEFC
ncbi:MAG: PhnD/SsuA/transferrin family substrate-binding protein [Rhodospirillaceae bacterium]|nr:PhnD/SsuA/transferrin family substrate-binding protein [Rhodospirillaceae bacterium]MBT5013851.1 PhnD/SsuA/transferrin family substrate-binding protein [Rhodospirillaceae bacterium]MBT7354940.1 PhnD/SsuA/transferrin family substrate-binding protein [Rhodospirillaceae bacterium]